MVQGISSDQELDDLISSSKGKLLIVDFFATWCGPCRFMAPVIEEMSSTYSQHVNFAKVDVDVQTEIAEKYNISTLPTFICFENEEKSKEILGANQNGIKAAIEEYVSSK